MIRWNPFGHRGATRLFFALAFLCFVAILTFTYSQSIDSVEEVLEEQLASYVAEVEEKLNTTLPVLDRETKLLARNVALRRLYSEKGSRQVQSISDFIESFKKRAQSRYLSIAYLTPSRTLLYDSGAAATGAMVGAAIASPFTQAARTVALDNRELTYYTSSINDTEVLLLSRSLKMGRTKGIVVAALPLNEFLPTAPRQYTTLTLRDRETGRVLYQTSGEVAATAIDSSLSITTLWTGHSQLLYSEIELESPGWIVSASMEALPYLAKPRRAGRITLLASIGFMLVVGFIIHQLQQRVERRSAALAQANNDIAERNARLEDAQKIIQAHNEKLEAELETASRMQMRLMPTDSPVVPGFSIAGHCRPATHVGGDFFQYYPRGQGRLSIAMADVTGHGMQAAIPTVLFSGMLENQMEAELDPETLMGNLNRSLSRSLERRTFVCFSLGELDPDLRRIRLVNGGCPYPYHYVAANATVHEVKNSTFPLGLRPASQYAGVDCDLALGDRIVFCSDGIIEAQNAKGQIFGFERTRLTIERLAVQGLPAAAMVDAMLAEVDDFCEGTDQDDDQTFLVIEAT